MTQPHTLKEVIDLAIKTAILRAHPIGSYYLTEGDEDPKDFIGGGWNRLKSLVIQASDDNHAAGTTAEAGLPNITGSFTATNNVCLNGSQSETPPVFQWDTGCFSVSGSGERALVPQFVVNTHADNRTLTFDARNSNSIYGKSDTVQPPARFVNVWKRVS